MEKENNLRDSIEPVNIKRIKSILNQMINCICKLKLKEDLELDFFVKFL